jgi:hypothetical protein
VRPMALSPDERYVYFQVSFFHGFVEYDLRRDRVLRLARLPLSEKAKKLRRDEYVLDSAHHGIAMNPAGNKLCVAGTMSDYAAVVHRSNFRYQIAARGGKSYWVTNSGDGRNCFVSFSGDDRVSVVSYASEREIASVRVGDHPQRMRVGRIRCAYLGRAVDCVDPRLAIKVKRRKKARKRLRVRVSEASRVRIVVARAKRGRRKAGRCRPAPKRRTKKRWCRRWAIVKVIRRRAHKGRNRYSLGKLRLRRRYRVDVRATDAAGNRSRKKVARFKLRRR